MPLSQLGKNMQSLITKTSLMPAYKRWYTAALLAGFLGWLAGHITGSILGATAYAFVIGSILMSMGFITWTYPYAASAWNTGYGKLLIPLIHIGALLLSTVLARNAVASILELPPQDFDLTVYILTLISYIPSLAIIAVVALSCFGIFALTTGSLISLIKRSDSPALLHGFGAIACAGLVFFAVDNLSMPMHKARYLVRWVAYYVDYYPSPQYPGSGHDRIRLHENGVISIASPNSEGEIDISIRMFQG